MSGKIKITIGTTEFTADLLPTPTAQAVRAALPLTGSLHRWGREVYFSIPIQAELEPEADDLVQPGDLAFWPVGQAFCLFWGPTPASTGEEIRAASAVNVFGRLHGDPARLDALEGDADIRVENFKPDE